MPPSPPARTPRIVVVGAGISGLVCAYELKKHGHPVLLLEQSDRPGGVIRTERRQDCLVEHGPQSFQSSERLDALLAELELEAELVQADPRAPRFIYFRDRLRPVPLGPGALFANSLLSARAKLALAREPFRGRGTRGEESVAEFFRRRFGDEILERLVEPFVFGVYGDEPERLSLPAVFPELARFEAEAGSVIWGFLKSRRKGRKSRRHLCSFRDGMSRLPKRLAAQLGDSLWLRARVASVRPEQSPGLARFSVEVERAGRVESLPADALVLAVPPRESARLVHTLAPSAAKLLESFAFASLAIAWVRCRKRQIPYFPGGFGFLVPRTEGLALRGTVFTSELFPGRAPADSFAFTCFIGGTAEELEQLSEADLGRIADSGLKRILRAEGSSTLLGVCRHPQAIPQYTLGHLERCDLLRREEAQVPGLFLTGNYLAGVSIGRCVEQASSTAARIRASLCDAGGE